MSYTSRSITPEWAVVVSTLVETLEDVLEGIDQDRHMGVRPDITALNALDTLNRCLDSFKTDLGV